MNECELLRRALEAGILCQHEIVTAVERQMTTLSDPGFCLKCGSQNDNCEPDARWYKCESCGERTVFGAQEILLTML